MDENLKRAYEIVEESTGNINLYKLQLKTLPSNIPRVVNGDFSCSANELTSLKNAPKIVKGSFYCYNNNLTSLKGAPKVVKGYFDCSLNLLTSLKHIPKIVKGDLFCSYNQIVSYDDLPPFLGGAIDYDSVYYVSIGLTRRNSLQNEKTLWKKI